MPVCGVAAAAAFTASADVPDDDQRHPHKEGRGRCRWEDTGSSQAERASLRANIAADRPCRLHEEEKLEGANRGAQDSEESTEAAAPCPCGVRGRSRGVLQMAVDGRGGSGERCQRQQQLDRAVEQCGLSR